VIFEVTQEEDGGFVAACVTAPIFTQADSWAELREQMQDAVRTHCFDRPIPPQVRLHFVRDELLKISRRDTKARREGSTPLDDLELGKPGDQTLDHALSWLPGFPRETIVVAEARLHFVRDELLKFSRVAGSACG